MKYKICRFQDGNGKEWYQIKIKWLFFWYNYEKITYANYDCAFWEFWGDRFSSKEDAQQRIDELIMEGKSRKIKLLECAEVLLVVLIAILCAVILNPIHKQNVEKIGKILYKFQDTLEFRDKDTDKTIKRLDNVEFRALDKSRFAYMVKLPDQSSEVLIFEDCPPNSYLKYFQTP